MSPPAVASRIATTGAVRGGHDGAGDCLAVDVTLIRERHAVRTQDGGKLADAHAWAHRDLQSVAIERDEVVEPVEIDQHAGRGNQRRPGMLRALHTGLQAASTGERNNPQDVLLVTRPSQVRRNEGLITDPVAPVVPGLDQFIVRGHLLPRTRALSGKAHARYP
jgi:hypothetical protein